MSNVMSWESFEKECADYLQKTYGDKAVFILHGSRNSTAEDIEVSAKSSHFWIEAKEKSAQCGQFVVKLVNGTFVFSEKNKSTQNSWTKQIIGHMNANKNSFKNPSTNGINLDSIDKQVFYKWIINYYKNKFVEYVITKNEQFIIFPIDEFEEYFDVSATYRIKKSGSSNPNKKDLEEIKTLLSIPNSSIISRDKRHYDIINAPLNKNCTLSGKKYDYLFKQNDDGSFRVTRLSNTKNANVIFQISLKKGQAHKDLEAFEKSI